MNERLRMISLFLVLLLILAVLGCGTQAASGGAKASNAQTAEKKQASSGGITLLVYSGAGLQKPMDALAQAFKDKTGIQIAYTYAGAGQNNSQILLARKGDLVVPGDVGELDPLKKENLVAWQKKAVYHIPVLAVPKGNPANIKNLADLAKPGVKVVLGDPKANPMGKISDSILSKAGILDQVNKNVVARTATVNEIIGDLSLRQADAGIISEENYPAFKDKVDLVPVPELADAFMVVPVAVLTVSLHPEQAQEFANFVTSPAGLAIWAKNGFKPYQGTD